MKEICQSGNMIDALNCAITETQPLFNSYTVWMYCLGIYLQLLISQDESLL